MSRIILQREQAEIACRVASLGAELDNVLSEADPPPGDELPEIFLGQTHRAHLAIEQIGEEFDWLGAVAMVCLVKPKETRFIASERCHQRLARCVEFAQLRSVRCGAIDRGTSKPRAHPIEDTEPALDRAADQRQEQLVDVKLFGCEPRAPAFVQLLGKIVRKLGRQFGIHSSPHDMVVECKARRADRLQHRVAQALAVVELFRVSRFEMQSAQMDGLHQQPVAGSQRMFVDMAGIGQMIACRLLTRHDLGVAGQGR